MAIFSIELLILLIVLAGVLYLYFVRNFDHWKNKNVPFIKPVPFAGNILEGMIMRSSMADIFAKLHFKSKDPYVGFFTLDQPSILIRDPNMIKTILATDFNHFLNRSACQNKQDDPISSHILFMIQSPEWKGLRNKVSPIFTSVKMRNMSYLIQESAVDFLKFLERSQGTYVCARDCSSKYTVDVIASTSYGVKAHCFEDENSAFRNASKKMFDCGDFVQQLQQRCHFIAPRLVKLFKMTLFEPSAVEFMKNSCLDIMQKRVESKTVRNDLIDLLVQLRVDDYFSKDDNKIVAQALQFFVAGFETTSTAMSFCIYELGRYPQYQKRLRNEIKETIAKFNGEINYDSIKEMTYLEMCLMETMRKYPPLPFLDRRCTTDYTLPGTDVVIQKGTSLFVSLLGLHNDPTIFPEPDVFNPERFTPEKRATLTQFFPFGVGPRNCIGERFGLMTAKIGLANVFKNFEFETLDKAERKVRFDARSTLLAPAGELLVKATKV